MPIQTAVFVVIALVLAGIAVQYLTRSWLKYRGARVITCPENHRPAGVFVDTRHAVASSLKGSLDLRLSSCSRWPERAGCGQQCLTQIAAAPEDCLVRNILVRWYAGRKCSSCGQPIGEISLAGSKPAVLLADKVTVEWGQIPADQLQDTLAGALPVCFACHMANTLVREHPELVVDRPGIEGTGSKR